MKQKAFKVRYTVEKQYAVPIYDIALKATLRDISPTVWLYCKNSAVSFQFYPLQALKVVMEQAFQRIINFIKIA